jgi:TorA maturation chaperone TorD
VELERQAMLATVSMPISDSEVSFVTLEEQTALQEPQTEQEQESIRDRYQELFAMHEQGKSVDYIAMQSGIQRGEVQLILQLAEREDVI